jgi:hypothetical protein
MYQAGYAECLNFRFLTRGGFSPAVQRIDTRGQLQL